MNIFKKGWVGALALTAAAMLTSPVMAAYGYKIGAATVDDVTTTACTTAAGQAVEGRSKGRGDDSQDMVPLAQFISRTGRLASNVCGPCVRLTGQSCF